MRILNLETPMYKAPRHHSRLPRENYLPTREKKILSILNDHLEQDRSLSSKLRYGRKTLPDDLILSAWSSPRERNRPARELATCQRGFSGYSTPPRSSPYHPPKRKQRCPELRSRLSPTYPWLYPAATDPELIFIIANPRGKIPCPQPPSRAWS